ncbi:MAG: tetratricopeptide repeat protein [Prevotella sp.]
MKAYYINKIFITIVASVLLNACGNQGCEDTRSEEQTERLRMLNDSIGFANAHYLQACDSMLAIAHDSLEYYEIFVAKGGHYTISNPADSMLYYANRTLAFTDRCECKGQRVNGIASKAYSLKATYYHQLRQNKDSAIVLFQKAYTAALQSDLKECAPDIAANTGDAYIFKDDLPKGAEWYRRALYLADSLNMPEKSTASIYMGLGRIYTQMQDYPTARKYYEDAEKRYDIMQPNMKIYFLNNYGNFYYYTHDYPNALKMFLRMRDEIISQQGKEGRNATDINLCRINLADVYLNLDNIDSARVMVERCEPFFRKYNIEAAIYYVNTIKIGICIKKNNLACVKNILSEEKYSYPIEQPLKSIRARYMKRYYLMIGNYDKALEIIEQSRNEEDSLAHNKMNMRANEIMLRFTADTLKLHHQLAINKKNDEMNAAYLTIAIVILLMIILMLGSAYLIIYIRKRRLQEQLNMVNLRLENARQRISPHLVFNVLNQQIGHSHDNDNTLIEMSNLIRSNLELMSKSYIPLSEEMDFVEHYVAIQQKLTGDSIDYTKDIKCDISKVMIPAMIVQILVENSFKHGLKAVEGDKCLNISIHQEDSATYITVEDNGPGFDCCRHCNSSTSTGLKVVRQIISLTNSNNKAKMKFGITNITSPDGNITGCRATLTIPNNIKYINNKSNTDK